jgi:SNF2 family DNA or RNA helicase
VYQPAIESYEHQLRCAAKVDSAPASPGGADVFALFCDMGTGKTKIILDEFGRREEAKENSDLLILAPTGSYRNWYADRSPDEPSELKKHLSPELFDRLVVCGWRSGMNKTEAEGLRRLLSERQRPRALVVNTESMASVELAVSVCSDFMSLNRSMFVVDESTKIRNGRAKRTKTILGLSKLARAKRIMSGLPTPKSPLDLYSQLDFLDWKILGHRTFWSFKMRYSVIKKMKFGAGKSFDHVVGYRYLDELQGLLEPYSFRVLKDECLDIPKKIYKRRDVELTKEQKRIYDDLLRIATAEIQEGEFVTVNSAITAILRLHQVASGFVVSESGDVHEVDNNRLPILLDLLEEFSGKAIIWAPYEVSINKIASALAREYGPEAVAKFWGGNRSTRHEDEARFLHDPACRFMVSTPASGGIGNNWTAATLVVYYANNYDLEQRSQSEDRAHRAGQTKSVTYVDLVATGTVDEKIIKVLRNKINMSTVITGDTYREWLI